MNEVNCDSCSSDISTADHAVDSIAADLGTYRPARRICRQQQLAVCEWLWKTKGWHEVSVSLIFARDSVCYCTHMLSQFRPSVRPSHWWISQKWFKFGSCNFHHTVVFARKVSSGNSDGFLLNGGVKQGWGRKNSQFSAINSPYCRNGAR